MLADNNRLGELSKITSTFDELVAAGKGEVTATITTAGVRPCLQYSPPQLVLSLKLLIISLIKNNVVAA